MNNLLQQALVKFNPWNIDSIEIRPDMLEIVGWAVMPKNVDFSFCYDVGGRGFEFEEVKYPLKGSGIEEVFAGFDEDLYSTGTFVCKTGMLGKNGLQTSNPYCRFFLSSVQVAF
jgi:hypothetical protein